MITTDECEFCRYGTIIEEDKARIRVYCSIKDKWYYFGQCIPCNFKEKKNEDNSGTGERS